MIINIDMINQKKSFSRIIAKFLQYECGLPLLGYNRNKDLYYFADTEELEEAINKIPWHLKMLEKVNEGFRF